MKFRSFLLASVVATATAVAGCAGTPTTSGPDKAAEAPRFVNTLGMDFVRVPAGEFTMGSDESADSLAAAFPAYERDRLEDLADESPAHRVRITRAFWLGRHEVTVGQFRRFLEASGHVPESVADGTGGYGYNPAYDPATTVRKDNFEGRTPKYSWRFPGFPQGDDHPVVNVTWNDAVAMARWLSAREGRRYRLPSEAEWEYACRAGTRTRFHTGDDPSTLAGAANVFDQRAARLWPQWRRYALDADDGHTFTSPVGSFAPNAFGLHDMHGNVWEWTGDWHAVDGYARSPVDDPTGPATGYNRVRRGGSWHTWPFYARCGYRNWVTPESRYTLIGFRLLVEAQGPTAEVAPTPRESARHDGPGVR